MPKDDEPTRNRSVNRDPNSGEHYANIHNEWTHYFALKPSDTPVRDAVELPRFRFSTGDAHDIMIMNIDPAVPWFHRTPNQQTAKCAMRCWGTDEVQISRHVVEVAEPFVVVYSESSRPLAPTHSVSRTIKCYEKSEALLADLWKAGNRAWRVYKLQWRAGGPCLIEKTKQVVELLSKINTLDLDFI